jgi:hypothetical protein
MQDPSLHDEQLENEIKLVGDLVLAASQSEAPMSQDDIDDVLGLGRDDDAAPGPPEDADPSDADPSDAADDDR